VQTALNEIRPTLQRDGGDVVLVDVTEDGIVKVQLTGACKGCPMSQVTLKQGIEKYLKSEVPEVVSVEAI
ncbi:MAG: NifU family protein, partial [Desulfobulbaceae bacterium]|nr:NifU family protein [Desulfobulbaceae bacterium]